MSGWKPIKKECVAVDENTRASENRQYKIEFKEHTKRVQAYKSNKMKTYALRWERCTKAMKNNVEARSDYLNKIKNDPVELLKAIKEHAHKYQENRYPMSIILDATRTLLGWKQKEMKVYKSTRRDLELNAMC
jgi:hypothetical protein